MRYKLKLLISSILICLTICWGIQFVFVSSLGCSDKTTSTSRELNKSRFEIKKYFLMRQIQNKIDQYLEKSKDLNPQQNFLRQDRLLRKELNAATLPLNVKNKLQSHINELKHFRESSQDTSQLPAEEPELRKNLSKWFQLNYQINIENIYTENQIWINRQLSLAKSLETPLGVLQQLSIRINNGEYDDWIHNFNIPQTGGQLVHPPKTQCKEQCLVYQGKNIEMHLQNCKRELSALFASTGSDMVVDQIESYSFTRVLFDAKDLSIMEKKAISLLKANCFIVAQDAEQYPSTEQLSAHIYTVDLGSSKFFTLSVALMCPAKYKPE